MKKLKLIVFITILLLVFVVAGSWLFKNRILEKAKPVYTGDFQVHNLIDSVQIYWDSIGVPHIFAQNERDLYFVTGYISAQERLWQMDLLRRVTTGRLSEIFGKNYINTDLLLRMLRIPEKSDKILQSSDSSVINALKAYAEGVNYFIDNHQDSLPPEFILLGYKPEKWEIQQSINLIGYIAWDLNGSWNSEIILHKMAGKLNAIQYRCFIPNYDSTLATIFPKTLTNSCWGDEMLKTSAYLKDLGMQIFHGSNNWAVSGIKTKSGKPVLANDMHLGYSIPGTWYQIHQQVQGKLNVTGVMLPGQPFIVSGHNQNIAWGLTNVMNDDIDFYKETIHPEDSNSYKYNGEWRKMKIVREDILIGKKDTVHAILRYTHRGPVVSEFKGISGEVISMHWMGNEMSNEVRSIYYVNRAENWDSFRDAMKTFISISQNAAYADIKGNIGLYCCAGIPIRKGGNPVTILPGDTSAYDWTGIVPFDSLPHIYNPAKGYVVSANNKTTSEKDFPYYISNWFDLPYRYNRINELLITDSLIDIPAVQSIQTDFHSALVKMYLPELLVILKKNVQTNKDVAEVFSLLNNWDCDMEVNSAPAAIFEVFYNEFIRNLVKDELGDKLFEEFISDKILVRHTFHNTWSRRGSVLCDNITTPKTETFESVVLQSVISAVNILKAEIGSDFKKWEWGNIHTITLTHPLGIKNILNRTLGLNRGPFPIGGSFHTVAPYSYKYNQLYKSSSGASQRHVYDLGNWDDSWSVIPTGNSGVPGTENYCNQTHLYLSGKYHHDWFSLDSISKNYKFKMVFKK